MLSKRGERMRNNNELPKCPLRFGGKCQHNRERCGKKEPAELIGKYGLPYMGWRRFPFFAPPMCWDMIRTPKFILMRRKGTAPKKEETRLSGCPNCWALDKDTGDIYKYEERPIGKQIQYIRTGEVLGC